MKPFQSRLTVTPLEDRSNPAAGAAAVSQAIADAQASAAQLAEFKNHWWLVEATAYQASTRVVMTQIYNRSHADALAVNEYIAGLQQAVADNPALAGTLGAEIGRAAAALPLTNAVQFQALANLHVFDPNYAATLSTPPAPPAAPPAPLATTGTAPADTTAGTTGTTTPTTDTTNPTPTTPLPSFSPNDNSGMTTTYPYSPDDPLYVDQGNGVKIKEIGTGIGGTGVQTGDTVKAYYTGWIVSTQQEFQDNRSTGPSQFTAKTGQNGVIQGFYQALLGMTPGEIRQVFIPADKAYGAQGSGSIPPNSDLVFEIKLASIN